MRSFTRMKGDSLSRIPVIGSHTLCAKNMIVQHVEGRFLFEKVKVA